MRADSHATQYFAFLDELGTSGALKFKFGSYSREGDELFVCSLHRSLLFLALFLCVDRFRHHPVIQFSGCPLVGKAIPKTCPDHQRGWKPFVAPYSTVVWVMMWSYWSEQAGMVCFISFFLYCLFLLLTDEQKKNTHTQSQGIFSDLEEAIQYLVKEKKRVVLVGELPTFASFHAECWRVNQCKEIEVDRSFIPATNKILKDLASKYQVQRFALVM